MTYEIRVNVDASFYKRPGDIGVMFSRKETYEREIAELVADMIGATHKFVKADVNIVPHDNDRDYTEADAEAHLNGEKRKTYAEDFFEKFPNAVKMNVLTDAGEVVSVPQTGFAGIYGDAKASEVRRKLNRRGNPVEEHFRMWLAEANDGE